MRERERERERDNLIHRGKKRGGVGGYSLSNGFEESEVGDPLIYLVSTPIKPPTDHFLSLSLSLSLSIT